MIGNVVVNNNDLDPQTVSGNKSHSREQQNYQHKLSSIKVDTELG